MLIDSIWIKVTARFSIIRLWQLPIVIGSFTLHYNIVIVKVKIVQKMSNITITHVWYCPSFKLLFHWGHTYIWSSIIWMPLVLIRPYTGLLKGPTLMTFTIHKVHKCRHYHNSLINEELWFNPVSHSWLKPKLWLLNDVATIKISK